MVNDHTFEPCRAFEAVTWDDAPCGHREHHMINKQTLQLELMAQMFAAINRRQKNNND